MKRFFLFVSICFGMCVTLFPVSAEESFDAFFSYIGTHEYKESNHLYDPNNGQTNASFSLWMYDEDYAKIAIQGNVGDEIEVSYEDNSFVKLEVGKLDRVSASIGYGMDHPHISIPEVVTSQKSFVMEEGMEYVWIQIQTKSLKGTYNVPIRIQNKTQGITKELGLTVNVEPLRIQAPPYPLDLWQYPNSSLRYYDFLQEESFLSEKHLSVLKEEMNLYKAYHGDSITVSIVENPWGDQTYDWVPSMVDWMMHPDGKITYHYDKMDAYIELCKSVGIDGQIDVFSILPWNDIVTVTLESDQSKVPYYMSVGSQEWKDIWSEFLVDFINHMEEKGWLEETYLFMDEREESQLMEVIQLVQNLPKEVHLGVALNRIPQSFELYEAFDSVSLSIGACLKEPTQMKAFVQSRKEKGLKTTLYNCSTNYPNSFAISNPDETVWTFGYLYQNQFDGFLRWAYNAWNENPNENLDYRLFEAGDIFLIYPDEKDSAQPQPKVSVRYCMMKKGNRNIQKLKTIGYMLGEDSVQNMISSLQSAKGNYNAYGAMVAASEASENTISSEVRRMEDYIQDASWEILQHKQLYQNTKTCE